jgi:hypothetical protein
VTRRWAIAVFGRGGWRQSIAPKAYHNDAGVDPRLVASDAATDAGETIMQPAALTPMGIDYARRGLPATAADALEDAASAAGAVWWVDYAGVTQVALARPTSDAPKARLLDYDPRTRSASVALDSPADLVVGSIIRDDRLAAPLTVAAMVMTVDGKGVRVDADTGAQDTDQLTDVLLTLIRREMARSLWGHYRYRVVAISGERLQLQAVRAAPGLPDQVAVTPWGVAGIHAVPKLSSEVMIAFEEGSASRPFVSHFVDGVAAKSVLAQKGNEQPAARKGDVVTILLPPLVLSGTINGAPFTGVAIAALGQTLGSITTGSEAFQIGDGTG